MQPRLVLGQASPKEGVVRFPKRAAVGQPSLLETGNVDVKPCQFLVDDGGLAGVVYLLKISRETRAHSSNVPACDAKSWSLR